MAELMEIHATGNNNGQKTARCDITISSPTELASLTEIDGYVLMNGSIAWDIENSDLYGLKDGTWYKQEKS